LVRDDGSIVGTIGGGLFEAGVLEFANTALKTRTSHRAMFSFTGSDAASKEMICGGLADVLVEYIDASNRIDEEVFRRLVTMTRDRDSGYLLTGLIVSPGSQIVGTLPHLLLDERGASLGEILSQETVLQAMPEKRLIKPAQVLEVQGCDCPVFLERLHTRGTIYLFGAGHVGECVAHLGAYVDFRVVVLDDRSEFANAQRFPEADQIMVVGSFADVFEELALDEDSYVVIVTRGHAHDKTVLSRSLRTRAGYIGMIGSRRKTNLIYQALMMEGFTREDLQRVNSPIGLPIGGETPQEIGVSIVAEMIQMRNRRDAIQRRGD